MCIELRELYGAIATQFCVVMFKSGQAVWMLRRSEELLRRATRKGSREAWECWQTELVSRRVVMDFCFVCRFGFEGQRRVALLILGTKTHALIEGIRLAHSAFVSSKA